MRSQNSHRSLHDGSAGLSYRMLVVVSSWLFTASCKRCLWSPRFPHPPQLLHTEDLAFQPSPSSKSMLELRQTALVLRPCGKSHSERLWAYLTFNLVADREIAVGMAKPRASRAWQDLHSLPGKDANGKPLTLWGLSPSDWHFVLLEIKAGGFGDTFA